MFKLCCWALCPQTRDDLPPVAQAPFYQGAGFMASVGIMTLYSTFVFTLARLLRWLLTGMAYRVPLEDMQDPSRLLQLVEDIKLARSEGDLMLEEQLYGELIHIYQSTELLKYWSRLDATDNREGGMWDGSKE